jgi:hypothetical protein
MALRTVRLVPEAEQALERITRSTGLSISGALNRGVLLLGEEIARRPRKTAHQTYSELDLGPGGYAVAPSTAVRRGVRRAIRRKLGRQR